MHNCSCPEKYDFFGGGSSTTGQTFHLSLLRPQDESAPQEELLDSAGIVDPWHRNSECILERLSHDSIPLTSRNPDGASINEECTAVLQDDADHVQTDGDYLMTLGEDVHLRDARGGKKKKKSDLFSCLGPARLSFRKKSDKANQSKSDATKLVKEI